MKLKKEIIIIFFAFWLFSMEKSFSDNLILPQPKPKVNQIDKNEFLKQSFILPKIKPYTGIGNIKKKNKNNKKRNSKNY